MEPSRPGTKACTGRAYTVRRFLEVFGIHPFFVPPVMPVVTISPPLQRNEWIACSQRRKGSVCSRAAFGGLDAQMGPSHGKAESRWRPERNVQHQGSADL